jgi:hypothetical protein
VDAAILATSPSVCAVEKMLEVGVLTAEGDA